MMPMRVTKKSFLSNFLRSSRKNNVLHPATLLENIIPIAP